MPNTKSAKKELRKNKTNNTYNAKAKNDLKSVLKKTKKAIDLKDSKAAELLAQALKTLDKAARKGVIKKNTRDRKKSRLHAKFNSSVKK